MTTLVKRITESIFGLWVVYETYLDRTLPPYTESTRDKLNVGDAFPVQAMGKQAPRELEDSPFGTPFFLAFLGGGIGALSVTELPDGTPFMVTFGCAVTTSDWSPEVVVGEASEDLGVS